MSSSVKALPLRCKLLIGRPGTRALAVLGDPINCSRRGMVVGGRDAPSGLSAKAEGGTSLTECCEGVDVEVLSDEVHQLDGEVLQRHGCAGCLAGDGHAPFPSRTHTCGELTSDHAGVRVVLAGWLLPERKVSKAMSFFPIKDSHGTTQLVLRLSDIPVESTVLIEGEDGTGDVEVEVSNFVLLNPANRNLPFVPSDEHCLVNEELRAEFRHLDLRRVALTNNIKKRSTVSRVIRDTLHHEGFLEVETPLLLKSSPEGAREFLVPSRVGRSANEADMRPLFYSLPQSPQQPKQLLICSGAIDKYFQIAKCFRDEDGRKDRQPEFTQIDLEMAYVSWGPPRHISESQAVKWQIGGHEVRAVVESLIRNIWQQVENVALPSSFDVMTYAEAMSSYGSDKPDTRFPLKIVNVSSLLPDQHRVRLEGSRVTLEALDRITITTDNEFNWLDNCRVTRFDIPLAAETYAAINRTLGVNPGDCIWVSQRRSVIEVDSAVASTALGRIRIRLAEIAEKLGDYTPPTTPHFLWVTEFPLFTKADPDKNFLAHGRWSSTHHPFTAPMWQDIEAMYAGRDKPGMHLSYVRGQHYDLVLNGVEIGGGSVRVHDAGHARYILTQVLQLTDSEKSTFEHLLHALRCGAPPHGGIALGFDRLMSILCKTASIRDVIAFPKTGAGTDPLFKSPATVAANVLHQYGIQFVHRS
ncbi:tRNA synthetases class II-domain-containing protein [Pisolithus thermaeus]|nr:tRNA synthetases class II-domain-containing protein [Pisolithus thermaeus]